MLMQLKEHGPCKPAYSGPDSIDDRNRLNNYACVLTLLPMVAVGFETIDVGTVAPVDWLASLSPSESRPPTRGWVCGRLVGGIAAIVVIEYLLG
jgi:hypothetical protein